MLIGQEALFPPGFTIDNWFKHAYYRVDWETDGHHLGYIPLDLHGNHSCRNPTLAKCGGEAQHLEKLEVGSPPGLPNVQSSIARGKTPRIEVFLVSLERS